MKQFLLNITQMTAVLLASAAIIEIQREKQLNDKILHDISLVSPVLLDLLSQHGFKKTNPLKG